MRTQRRVFEKLSETTKVELASEKIELSIKSEIKDGLKSSKGVTKELETIFTKIDKLSTEYKTLYKKNQSEIRRAEGVLNFLEDTLQKVDKMADELGVDSNRVSGYKDLVTTRNVIDKMLGVNKNIAELK